MFERSLMAFLLAALLLSGQRAVVDELLNALHRAAPQLEKRALQDALQALQCAEREGAGEARRLVLIDYSRSSLERRLWVFDLMQRQLLLREFVADGRQSGELFAERVSNLPGSHQSSLGCFAVVKATVAGMGIHCASMAWSPPSMNGCVPGRW